MKKTFIALALMAVLPLTAMAAETAKTEVAPAKDCKKGAWLTKDLGLNAEQQTKVDALFEQNEVKKKALHDELSAQIKEVLTPEQHAKMKEKHDQMKAKHAEMKGKHSCPAE
jgi:Spy/CpxP family protein refolding chaperone